MKYIFCYIFALALVLITSCSDDVISVPNEKDCKLMSFTDSSNYFYKLKYENEHLSNLEYYKFQNGKIEELVRTVTIFRNFFNEINYINYVNEDGVLEAIDSVFMDNNGYINEIVHYDGKGDISGKEVRVHNKRGFVTEEKSYNYKDEWELASNIEYEYDDDERVVRSVYELFTDTGSNKDTTTYTYDNMKNVQSKSNIFTVFRVNNKLTETTKYTLNNGKVINETLFYEYTYNKKGYPIKVKITSSLNADDVKYKYFNFDCP